MVVDVTVEHMILRPGRNTGWSTRLGRNGWRRMGSSLILTLRRSLKCVNQYLDDSAWNLPYAAVQDYENRWAESGQKKWGAICGEKI